MPEWLLNFPAMTPDALRSVTRSIDAGYLSFSRAFGDAIESFFDPLLLLLIWFEQILLRTPWVIILMVLGLIAYGASRNLRLVAGVLTAFLLIGYFGMWENTMRTLAIILVCTIIALMIGIPTGI